MGRRLIAVGLGSAFLMVIPVWATYLTRSLWWTTPPQMTVDISPVISTLSRDERGTDALATITNRNPTPVDVTIRVRGFDISDRAVTEKTIGPFRSVSAGGTRDIQVRIDATPLKSVTFEAIDVSLEARP